MIPKPLNEITWSDIEALKVDEREEDDMLEYKQAFSLEENGVETLHYDYAALNKNQRKKANDSIAKHAIAFLNGRGGDLILGVKELSKENPAIAEFTPIHNIVETRDRLERAMAEVIEPRQTALSIKAVISPEDTNVGVLVVRANSSLRAPHRSTISKDCYVRRGRESVPMPMDEVQDLTIRRTELRRERSQFLSAQFADLDTERVGRTSLDDRRFHIRTVFVPVQEQQIEIDEGLCQSFCGSDPILFRPNVKEAIDLPFRNLGFNWRPVLRGKRVETFTNNWYRRSGFTFCAKEARCSGTLLSEFACCIPIGEDDDPHYGFYHDWIAGYLANTLVSFERVWRYLPRLGEGVIRIAMRSRGNLISVMNNGVWGHSHHQWPNGVTELPDFPILDSRDFTKIFRQVQLDAASIIGIELTNPFQFSNP